MAGPLESFLATFEQLTAADQRTAALTILVRAKERKIIDEDEYLDQAADAVFCLYDEEERNGSLPS